MSQCISIPYWEELRVKINNALKTKFSLSNRNLVEVELFLKTCKFDLYWNKYNNLRNNLIKYNEKTFKFHNEPNSVLRLTKNTTLDRKSAVLKNRVSDVRYEDVALRVSIERDVSSDKILLNSLNKNEELQRGKLALYMENGVREIERIVVRRSGYEIHYTRTIDDSYVEFEFTSAKYDENELYEDLIDHMDKFVSYRKIWEVMINFTPNMKVQKPIDMYKGAFRSNKFLMEKTFVTQKHDGLRILIYIDNGKIFTVDLKGNHQLIIEDFHDLPGTYIFDTERVNNSDGHYDYLAFDLLYCNIIDISKESYTYRLSVLESLKILPPNVILKTMIRCKSYKTLSKEVKRAYEKQQLYDGVIIYNPDKSYWDNNAVFKYKFVPTIDVETDGNIVCLRQNKALHQINMKIANMKPLGNLVVMEASYDQENNILIPVRLRFDKTHANSYKVYESMMNAYKKGDILDLDIMRGVKNSLFFFRVCHNIAKVEIISQCSGVILDIGSGRGGDLAKWMHNRNITKVIAIEPNIDNYNELMHRKESMKINKVIVHNTSFENFQTKTKINSMLALFMINSITPDNIQSFFMKCYNLLEENGKLYILFMDYDKLRYIDEPGMYRIRDIDTNTYQVDLEDTMVNNLIEYKYNTGSLIEHATLTAFDEAKIEKGILNYPWLSDKESKLNKMFSSLVLTK